jgi:hypothetical protein
MRGPGFITPRFEKDVGDGIHRGYSRVEEKTRS